MSQLTIKSRVSYDSGMRDTRTGILEALHVRGGQTVSELAGALRVTRTAVTAHLAALQAEGAVTRAGLRRGRRRPSIVYEATRRTGALFPSGYEELSAALLEALAGGTRSRLEGVLRQVGRGWIERDRARVDGLWGSARIEVVRQILEERGFLPTVERAAEGYVLREHHCPLMRLTAVHPEVCDMVHRWLEGLVGGPVRRAQCLRDGTRYSEYQTAPP